MRQLRLDMSNKKEIVLDALKSRSPRRDMESISSFVGHLLSEYRYSQGADRYFWKAIRELEQEGKIERLRQGKGKVLFLLGDQGTNEELKERFSLKKWVAEKRLEVIKDFLCLWEAYNVWEDIPSGKSAKAERVDGCKCVRQ